MKERNLTEKQTGAMSQQIVDWMELAEEGEPKTDNRIYLAVIDQNVMKGNKGEGSSSKSKRGRTWVRI